jgi:hypothetical protein
MHSFFKAVEKKNYYKTKTATDFLNMIMSHISIKMTNLKITRVLLRTTGKDLLPDRQAGFKKGRSATDKGFITIIFHREFLG